MEVQCPQCQSKFHLPDAAVRPNVKLRCSVCKHVFKYEGAPLVDAPSASMANNTPPPAAPAMAEAGPVDAGVNLDLDSSAKGEKKEKKSGGKGKIFISLLVLLLCIGGGVGVWWYMFKQPQGSTQADKTEVSENIKQLTITHLRQYYLTNEKFGGVFVIEGKVLNNSAVPKELIKVEAAIYTADKKVLVDKKQLAGTVLSRFQLEVLSKEELESFLNNEIEILTKNTNIPTGGDVPFMVIFYDPPAEMAEFGIKVFSAQDVKKN